MEVLVFMELLAMMVLAVSFVIKLILHVRQSYGKWKRQSYDKQKSQSYDKWKYFFSDIDESEDEAPEPILSKTYIYKTYGGYVFFFTDFSKYLFIELSRGIFDYYSYCISNGVVKYTLGTVEYYDENYNIIDVEKENFIYVFDDQPSQCAITSERAIEYLKNAKGYIRLKIDIYNSDKVDYFDVKIPTFALENPKLLSK